MLGGQTGPFLKKLVVGSESANNVYLEKVDVYNMYAMSESGLGRQGDGSIVPLSPPLPPLVSCSLTTAPAAMPFLRKIC